MSVGSLAFLAGLGLFAESLPTCPREELRPRLAEPRPTEREGAEEDHFLTVLSRPAELPWPSPPLPL